MFKITYKVSGVPMTVSFEDRLDMIMFVASNKIKDEDLVSINLNEDNDIEGGIDGLCAYAINKVVETKKAMEEAAKDNDDIKSYVVDIYDNQNNRVDFVEIDASSAEEAELIAENDYCAEDEYAVVQSQCDCDDCDCCPRHCTVDDQCDECENCSCNVDDNDAPELMTQETKSAYNDMIDSFDKLMADFKKTNDKLYIIKEDFHGMWGYPRYIQLGEYSRQPNIITRPAYAIRNTLAFNNVNDALTFIEKFNADRNRTDINWKVVEYKPKYKDVVFTKVNTKFGEVFTVKSYN